MLALWTARDTPVCYYKRESNMVVFFDIDGTIIDEATQVLPQSAIDAVAELGRLGHIAVVNTGRPRGHIDPRVRAMAFQGWICGCGMELYLGDRWLYRKAPDAALCKFVRDSVRECRMQVLYEAESELLSDGRFSLCPKVVKEAARMQKKGFVTREIDSLPEAKFVKFVTHNSPECRRGEFLQRMEPYFTCIDRGGGMVEYVLKGCSKAEGMEKILSCLGVDRENTLAIGDSTNDLPMFRAAGHTAALGDGMAELKAEAEFITASVLQDGVAKALAHFGLLQTGNTNA